MHWVTPSCFSSFGETGWMTTVDCYLRWFCARKHLLSSHLLSWQLGKSNLGLSRDSWFWRACTGRSHGNFFILCLYRCHRPPICCGVSKNRSWNAGFYYWWIQNKLCQRRKILTSFAFRWYGPCEWSSIHINSTHRRSLTWPIQRSDRAGQDFAGGGMSSYDAAECSCIELSGSIFLLWFCP